MINVQANNVAGFISAISKWEEDALQEIEAVAVGYIGHAFRFLVENSAQGSGDFAANWNYSINELDYSFTRDAVDGGGTRDTVSFILQDRIMGHPLAVNYAIDNARQVQAQFALGDKVYFTNAAQHDENYAWKIENNQIKFRSGNEGAPRAKTKLYMSKYEFITPSVGQQLKASKL